MSKLTLNGKGDVHSVIALLQREIPKSGFTCELVDVVHRDFGESAVCVMVFDKCFIRRGNRASLTVVVTGAKHFVRVDAISSGGNGGVFKRISLGREKNFISSVADILQSNGFS